MERVLRKYHLGNEQIYREWMSAWFWIEIEIPRKFEETTHTQKYEKTHRRKNNMPETREEAKRHLLLRKTRQAFAKENQTGINAEKDQASILENQTIVTYTDDELVSIRQYDFKKH